MMASPTEKILPQNSEAERGVLGSLLIDPDAFVEVADFLRASDFRDPPHQTIYQAIYDLYEDGTPADLITLTNALERRGQIEDVGGAWYVSSLANQVPTSANLIYYARIVKDKATLRQLIKAAGQIAGIAYNEADARVALEQAEQLIFSIAMQARGTRRGRTMREIMGDVLDQLAALSNQTAEQRGIGTGVATGFADLDRLLGGFQRTDLIILAGRPGMGKSSLADSIAVNLAERKLSVLLFSLEMGDRQIGERFLAMRSRVPLQKLRVGPLSDDDMDAATRGAGEVAEYGVTVDDTAGLTIAELRTRARRAMLERPYDLLIVDYLQLLHGSAGENGRMQNRVQEVSEISRGLKELARELDVPVLALSQLSRAVESREDKQPILSDLRDSGSVEQDADVVAFVYRDAVYNPDSERKNIADIIVAKHRNGPIGTISLYFKGEETRFRDLEMARVEPDDLGGYGYGGSVRYGRDTWDDNDD